MKEKRSLIQPLIKKIRNNYNVSISELDGKNDLSRCTLGIAHIDSCGRDVNRKLSKLVSLVERSRSVSVIDYSLEVL